MRSYYDLLSNPLIDKRGKHVLVGGVPSREITFEELKPNMLNVGPFGHVAEFFGYYHTTKVLYLLATEEDTAWMREGIQSGTIIPPLFPRRRAAFWGRGTLDVFLKKKETRKIIAAVQYYTYKGDVVFTHMVVRSKWRRAHINKMLIDMIIDHTKPVNIWWEEPTELGRGFMWSYGQGQDLEDMPRE
jgi:hypothetical protein